MTSILPPTIQRRTNVQFVLIIMIPPLMRRTPLRDRQGSQAEQKEASRKIKECKRLSGNLKKSAVTDSIYINQQHVPFLPTPQCKEIIYKRQLSFFNKTEFEFNSILLH